MELVDAAGFSNDTAQQAVNFRCILDRILVRELPVEEQIIHRPGVDLQRSERFLKKPDRGIVVAVGDGVPMGGVLMPMPYQVGQTVKCSEYGREYLILKPEDEFDKDAPKYYLIRVADTHGELL